MNIIAMCIGGPRHGERINVDKGQPEYRFEKRCAAPILEIHHAGPSTVKVYQDRYIRKTYFNGHTIKDFYVWEYTTEIDAINMLKQQGETYAKLKENT